MDALFRTVEETAEAIQADIKGDIPGWLKGSLLRVGPGLFEVGDQSYNHLFDGQCIIYRFNIEGSKVTYQSRYLRSDSYVLAQQQNRIVVSEFGTNAYPDPCKSIFSRFFSYFTSSEKETDNCNVNLMQVRDEVYTMTETPVMWKVDPQTLDSVEKVRDEVYTMTETPVMWKVDPQTLDSVEKVDRSKYVALNMMTAHPHIEPDGTIWNMATRFGKDGLYGLVKIPLPDEGERSNPMQKAYMLGTIPQKSAMYPKYFHSFGLTPNYVIFIEQPMYVNVWKLMWSKLLSGKSVSYAMEFDPKTQVQFHVFEKATGKVLPTKYLADSFFTFHHINAYEEDGQLVVDVCCAEKGDIVADLYLSHLRGISKPEDVPEYAEARRYVLPLQPVKAAGEENPVTLVDTNAAAVVQEDGSVFCTPELLCQEGIELPRINYNYYNGKKYQFFYGVAGFDQLGKVDVHTKSMKLWKDSEGGCFPSEPIFMPAPDASSEDEGVVLSLVVKSSGEARSVFLLVLDGETFTELARAEVPSPAAACFNIHGIFMPDV